MDEKLLGNKLKQLRQNRDMRQTDLAQGLSVSISTISHWEKGRRFPSVFEIKRIADFFGIDVNVLLDPAYQRKDLETSPVEKVRIEFFLFKRIAGLHLYLSAMLALYTLLLASILFQTVIAYAIFGFSAAALAILILIYAYAHRLHSKERTRTVRIDPNSPVVYRHEKEKHAVERRQYAFIALSILSLTTLFLFFFFLVLFLFDLDRFVISPFIITTVGIIVITLRIFLHWIYSKMNPFVHSFALAEVKKRMNKNVVHAIWLLDLVSVAVLILFMIIYRLPAESTAIRSLALLGFLTFTIDTIIVYGHHVFASSFHLVDAHTNRSVETAHEGGSL
ncbi:MAG: helix-turn-helix domain-containing protein [Acholeplasmataceae bacterium]